MKFSDKTKALVRERTQMLCDRCGLRVQYPHYHHRRPRGMGGSKNIKIGGASNCLLLHPNCHEWIERNRVVALQNGWLVSSWDIPSLMPVMKHGEWVLLDDDGSVEMLFKDEVTDVDSAVTTHPSEGIPRTSPF